MCNFTFSIKVSQLALLRLLQFVLTKTALKFRNMLYEQITERTMRRTCAQNYVITTVGKHEIKFLAISRLKPLKRWRYLDDIYMIWPNTLQELSCYLEALNSFHKNIRFITEGSDIEANFLNVTVQKDNQGHIQTAFYNPPPPPPPPRLTLNEYLQYSSFLLNLRNKVYQTARPYDYVE